MIQKATLAVLTVLLIACIITIATGNSFLITGVQRTYLSGNITANINDHKVFDVATIKTNNPNELPKSKDYNSIELEKDFKEQLIGTKSAAFLVIKDGEVVSENYFNGYDHRSKTNSFSMAKTVTTLLLGIAIEEGMIDSIEQNVTDFIPEFLDDELGKDATIAQFSLMNSGYEWVEHYYSPFSPTVRLLYGHDVENYMLEGSFSKPPGEFFEYSSASTQILGIVLDRAIKKHNAADSISDYLSKKIWQPMQMNDDALWHTDKKGMELVYCCINTNARNYARLGLLMLNDGKWNNQQLVPADFVKKMISPVAQPHYGYSTWLNYTKEPNYYWFSGHLGQYIMVVPQYNMIIVRLGERRDSNVNFRETELPEYVRQAKRIIGAND